MTFGNNRNPGSTKLKLYVRKNIGQPQRFILQILEDTNTLINACKVVNDTCVNQEDETRDMATRHCE